MALPRSVRATQYSTVGDNLGRNHRADGTKTVPHARSTAMSRPTFNHIEKRCSQFRQSALSSMWSSTILPACAPNFIPGIAPTIAPNTAPAAIPTIGPNAGILLPQRAPTSAAILLDTPRDTAFSTPAVATCSITFPDAAFADSLASLLKTASVADFIVPAATPPVEAPMMPPAVPPTVAPVRSPVFTASIFGDWHFGHTIGISLTPDKDS